MAATVKIYVYIGAAPGSGAAIEGANDVIQYKLEDDNIKNANNPCIRPTAGYNRSFKKTVAMHATVAPDISISNCKVYTDGSLSWTDTTIFIGDEFSDTYEQGVIDPADPESGKTLTDYAEISNETDLFTYTSMSPCSLELSASWANTTGRITKYIGLQARLGTSATGGAQGPEGLTFQFDEV